MIRVLVGVMLLAAPVRAPRGMARVADYDTTITQLMAGLRRRESGGNYKARNSIGASGAYQFMDGTWNNYGGYRHAADAPPEIQDERARQLLGAYFRFFDGDLTKVAMSWLQGSGATAKGFDRSDGSATASTYARQVLAYAGLSPGSTPVPAQPSGTGGKVGAGMSVGGTDQFAGSPDDIGTDLHDVDVQAQTILGMLSRPVPLLDQTTKASS